MFDSIQVVNVEGGREIYKSRSFHCICSLFFKKIKKIYKLKILFLVEHMTKWREAVFPKLDR